MENMERKILNQLAPTLNKLSETQRSKHRDINETEYNVQLMLLYGGIISRETMEYELLFELYEIEDKRYEWYGKEINNCISSFSLLFLEYENIATMLTLRCKDNERKYEIANRMMTALLRVIYPHAQEEKLIQPEEEISKHKNYTELALLYAAGNREDIVEENAKAIWVNCRE